MRTQLTETMLVELRRKGFESRTTFIDPHVLSRAQSVIARRGEEWVESVLGRDVTARSIIDTNRVYLKDGEQYTLVAADRAEDKLALPRIEGA